MRDNFLFYRNIRDSVKTLPDESRLKFFDAICDYALDDIEPCFSGLEASLWNMIKFPFDENKKKYEAGKKGGRPSKKPTLSEEETTKKVGFEEENHAFEKENHRPYIKGEERSKKKEVLSNKCKEREEKEEISLTLEKFQKAFPDKVAEVEEEKVLTMIDMDLLIKKIKESEFLRKCKNIDLDWSLRHYDSIIHDKYKDFAKQNEKPGFSQREYDEEFLSSLFHSLDEIQIE